MKEDVDRQLVLHYIDKTHSTYTENAKTFNRVSVFLILFSLLVIAISSGVISANQEVSVAGMKLEMTYWVFLLSGIWLIGCCFAYMAALFCHGSYLENTILRLYASIGFSDKSLNEQLHTLVTPDPLTLMSLHIENKGFRWTVVLISGVVLLLIPITAEVLVAYRLFSLLGVRWWLVGTFIFLLFINISYLTLSFKKAWL